MSSKNISTAVSLIAALPVFVAITATMSTSSLFPAKVDGFAPPAISEKSFLPPHIWSIMSSFPSPIATSFLLSLNSFDPSSYETADSSNSSAPSLKRPSPKFSAPPSINPKGFPPSFSPSTPSANTSICKYAHDTWRCRIVDFIRFYWGFIEKQILESPNRPPQEPVCRSGATAPTLDAQALHLSRND